MAEVTPNQSNKQPLQPLSKNAKSVSETGEIQPQEKSQNQWKLETPEYLLLVVIGLILWTLGFVDMINHTSTKPTIFGLYSTSYFILLVIYTLGFGPWIFLLARPSHSNWLTKSVTAIQKTPWLAALALGIIAFLIWDLMGIQPETSHPLSKLSDVPVVRFTFVCLLLMAGVLIIFGGWTQVKPVQTWRKVLAILLGAVLLVEFFFQIMAATNLLPGTQKIADLFIPYGKVYYEGENFVKGRLNNYGLYYPDLNMADESERILLMGDTFIQALQISPDQHLGVLLNEKINNDAKQAQVMALGYPGFGPSLYLNTRILPYTIAALSPNEIVAVVQLGSDLDNSTLLEDSVVNFEFDEEGNAKVHPDPDNFEYWHDLSHFAISGFRPLDPLAVIRANYLTPRLFDAFSRQTVAQQPTISNSAADEIIIPGFEAEVTEWGPPGHGFTVVKSTVLNETPGTSNYLFESQASPEAEEALAIFNSLIKQTNDYAEAEGISFRVVTIPIFPASFYQQYQNKPWQPEIGNYDLFRPDRELRAFSEKEGIPFLSIGQLMYDKDLPTDQIKSFYYADGTGHLTPAGHQFLAEALYACFYANQETGAQVPSDASTTTACMNN